MPGGMLLTRRNFLALSTALAQNSVQKQMRPRALRPGDTVGLITPSSYVSDPDRLALAERTLRYFDLKPKFSKNVRRRNGYLGGSIDERLDDLHAMFADPLVSAVFAIRGGYRLAPQLHPLPFRLAPPKSKILVRYSDITSPHPALPEH